MIFREELVEAIRDGRKTVTRRRSDKYKVGKSYAVQPGRGKKAVARINVTGVTFEPGFTGRVTDREAHREGAKHAADFLRIWREIHGEEPVDVYRVEFVPDLIGNLELSFQRRPSSPPTGVEEQR